MSSRLRVLAACGAVIALVFVVDILAWGVAAGVPYIAAVMIALWSPRRSDVLVVAEWDRATRSMMDGIAIIDRVLGRGALVKVLDKPHLDLTGTIGKGLLAFLSAIAQDERAEQGMPKRKQSKETGARKESAESAAAGQFPQPAFAASKTMAGGNRRLGQGTGEFLSPGMIVKRDPWQFLGVMLMAGLASGLLLRFKTLRRVLRLYAALRKS